MTLTVPASDIDKNLDTACASVVSEVGRTDGKASLLLAFDGAVLAGLASVPDKDLPPAAKAFGTLAVLALGAAAVLLPLVVRPRLRGDDRASFPHWARLDEDEIRACMDDLSLAALVLLALAAAGLAL
ncbi:Pycsar system effector family protein [Streptomyces mirabilis]|jgi:hypothetical protein|uniref:Pycsar effector protein domain-containing protein n=1 Tax=Streptomyces mirabilis TaxID=68239 RepID=A0A1I2N200_9ACTN|nr:Pycsar system effector family protein [Streptomyces mirabilis]SFF97673.1 hypothetical protein SAMN02787118_114142 [Streptomyces mirabilis]